MIVPGYGVCDLELGDTTRNFTTSDIQSLHRGQHSQGLQCLSLEFFQIEDPSLVPGLLRSIGGNLRSLKMGIFWSGRHRSLALDAVAAACRHLDELHLTNFDVVLSSHEGLDNWGSESSLLTAPTRSLVWLTD